MSEAKGKTGPNVQANAIIDDMVKKGLIRCVVSDVYRITESGRLLAAQYRVAP